MTHSIFLILGADAKLDMTFFLAELFKEEFHSQHLMTLIVWLETITIFSFISSLILVGDLGAMYVGETSKRR